MFRGPWAPAAAAAAAAARRFLALYHLGRKNPRQAVDITASGIPSPSPIFRLELSPEPEDSDACEVGVEVVAAAEGVEPSVVVEDAVLDVVEVVDVVDVVDVEGVTVNLTVPVLLTGG